MLKIDGGLMERYLRAEMAMGFRGEKWEKFLRSRVAWLVELEDGTIYAIKRESIETDFCFGESGYDFDEACEAADRARTSESYFRAKNLSGINEKLRLLGERTMDVYGVDGVRREFEPLYISPGDVVDSFFTRRYWYFEEDKVKKLSFDDRRKLLEGYRLVRDDFGKRIDRYLARYGLSKVHAWTYWRDA